METFYERRGNYQVTCYRIPVDQEMKDRCLAFAREIIRKDDQYSRLLPEHMRGRQGRQPVEVMRTAIGKLGELAFLRLLEEKGLRADTEGMFTIYEGQENVDSFDFQTEGGKSVDVKAGFRPNHTRLLVNHDQLERSGKDYYVAVKFNGRDINEADKLVDWDSITHADILGYAEGEYLKNRVRPINFGEAPAYAVPYNRLMGIDRLLRKFEAPAAWED